MCLGNTKESKRQVYRQIQKHCQLRGGGAEEIQSSLTDSSIIHTAHQVAGGHSHEGHYGKSWHVKPLWVIVLVCKTEPQGTHKNG